MKATDIEINPKLGVAVGTYMLAIMTATIQPSKPEFVATLRQAKLRRDELERLGYRVRIFRVTKDGIEYV